MHLWKQTARFKFCQQKPSSNCSISCC